MGYPPPESSGPAYQTPGLGFFNLIVPIGVLALLDPAGLKLISTFHGAAIILSTEKLEMKVFVTVVVIGFVLHELFSKLRSPKKQDPPKHDRTSQEAA